MLCYGRKCRTSQDEYRHDGEEKKAARRVIFSSVTLLTHATRRWQLEAETCHEPRFTRFIYLPSAYARPAESPSSGSYLVGSGLIKSIAFSSFFPTAIFIIVETTGTVIKIQQTSNLKAADARKR